MSNLINLKVNQQILVYLYRDLLNHTDNNKFASHCLKEWPIKGKLQHNIKNINISTTVKDMLYKYKTEGIIELRPYNGEDILVVGCGNYPLVDCGGYSFRNKEAQNKYHCKHKHINCYTVNPSLAYNPSILAFYSYHTLGTIPDKSFSKIIVEGIRLKETSIFASETLRLLKENGVLSNGKKNLLVRRANKLKYISDSNNELDYEINKFDIFNSD
jgi:hypothetical protein